MGRNLMKSILFVLLIGLLLPSPAWTDGQARSATAGEKSFHNRVGLVFQQALPTGPPGWTVSRQTGIKDLVNVAEGNENQPMTVDCQIVWENAAKRDRAGEAMTRAGLAALEKQRTAKPTAELEAAYTGLAEKLGRAVEQGRMDEVQKIQVRLEALGRELSAAHEDQDRAFKAAARSEAVGDVKASISLTANLFSASLEERAVERDPVAGWPSLTTPGRENSGYDRQEGVVHVFLGSGWRLDPDQPSPTMIAQPRTGPPHTAVQTIVVRIQAAPERAERLIAAMDWSALGGLLDR